MHGDIRIVSISDTHEQEHRFKIPHCDILIHSGDFMRGYDRLEQLSKFIGWLAEHSAKYKIFVPGNHDDMLEKDPKYIEMFAEAGITLLCLDHVDLYEYDLRVYGSPLTPRMRGNYGVTPQRAPYFWDKVGKCDILVTHPPPLFFNDYIPKEAEHAGCSAVLKYIQEKQPALHICGHIHEGYGVSLIGDTVSVNSAVLNGRYQPTNAPWMITLREKKVVSVKPLTSEY